MGVSILYPSWQNRLPFPSTKPRHLLYISPYALRTISCVRVHHTTEPTRFGLGPIEPTSRSRASMILVDSMGPSPTHVGSVI